VNRVRSIGVSIHEVSGSGSAIAWVTVSQPSGSGLHVGYPLRVIQQISPRSSQVCPTENGLLFTRSSLVHELLRAGGSERRATGWGSRIWFTTTPSDVLDYVDSMRGSDLVITPSR